MRALPRESAPSFVPSSSGPDRDEHDCPRHEHRGSEEGDSTGSIRAELHADEHIVDRVLDAVVGLSRNVARRLRGITPGVDDAAERNVALVHREAQRTVRIRRPLDVEIEDLPEVPLAVASVLQTEAPVRKTARHAGRVPHAVAAHRTTGQSEPEPLDRRELRVALGTRIRDLGRATRDLVEHHRFRIVGVHAFDARLQGVL